MHWLIRQQKTVCILRLQFDYFNTTVMKLQGWKWVSLHPWKNYHITKITYKITGRKNKKKAGTIFMSFPTLLLELRFKNGALASLKMPIWRTVTCWYFQAFSRDDFHLLSCFSSPGNMSTSLPRQVGIFAARCACFFSARVDLRTSHAATNR